ncbi:MarR family winged helix-turn-helix transcriptional regulator [Maricaulis sp.]|uniref:MarR family winged helix-turn-helix transcriptional regulator n=1 Tax=Maricaulis sp. TaxID=1486257 RepID=UPI003A957C61
MATMDELASLHLIFNEIRGVDADLPVSHPAALVFIAAHQKKNKSPRVSDITTGLGMMPSSVTRMLTSLERRKLISRKKDRADARTTRILITNRGLELIERMLGHATPEANVSDWSPRTVPLPAKGFIIKISQDREGQLQRLERLEAEMISLKDDLQND